VRAQRSVVSEFDVERARLTVIAAAEPVAVAGEPLVDAVGDAAHIRNLEYPRDELSAREDIQQLFDRRRTLPRSPAWSDELQRLGVGACRNPREARGDA